MNIGIYKRTVEVDPVELPIKKKEQPEQEPVKEIPEREPVQVSAR